MPSWRQVCPDLFPEENEVEARISSKAEGSTFPIATWSRGTGQA